MDLKRLQQFGTLKSYQRGHILFKIGDLDPNMYIILKGAVSVRSKIGDSLRNEILDAGKFFGETTVILNIPKMDICVIEENDTTLLSIPRTRFENMIKEDQGFAMRIMCLLSEQLLEAIGERENIALKMRKYEAIETAGQIEDLYSPLTPEKNQKQPEKEEQETPKEQKEQKTVEGMTIADPPEMLHAMQILKGVGVVPSNHGVYGSRQWPGAQKYISPKVMTCPICGETFSATYLSRSRLGVVKTSPDTRRQYEEIEPIYFDVYTCRYCGYANFPEDFSKLKTEAARLVQSELLIIKKQLPYDLDENIFDINYVFLKLYLTLFCNAVTKDSVLTGPKIWMRLSWLYEDIGDAALALFATEQAYHAYTDIFYNTKTFVGEAEREVLLLLGELAFKLGMEKEAINHFMLVLQSGTTNNVHRKKAEDRVYDLRQKAKEEAAKEKEEAAKEQEAAE